MNRGLGEGPGESGSHGRRRRSKRGKSEHESPESRLRAGYLGNSRGSCLPRGGQARQDLGAHAQLFSLHPGAEGVAEASGRCFGLSRRVSGLHSFLRPGGSTDVGHVLFICPSVGGHAGRFGTEVSFVTWLNVVRKAGEGTEGVGG